MIQGAFRRFLFECQILLLVRRSALLVMVQLLLHCGARGRWRHIIFVARRWIVGCGHAAGASRHFVVDNVPVRLQDTNSVENTNSLGKFCKFAEDRGTTVGFDLLEQIGKVKIIHPKEAQSRRVAVLVRLDGLSVGIEREARFGDASSAFEELAIEMEDRWFQQNLVHLRFLVAVAAVEASSLALVVVCVARLASFDKLIDQVAKMVQ